ncbi:glycoside hydrolase family 3 protein [Sporormia fimetaria CBS 119925]|uniref:Probable beta-glucosidase E n=1 Tax=Sporormia fimetaria CBS 119925 TaxID=1340428 RepID=A0A6A6VJ12_9PLEO|nr:glycoside hydrolase family 3 protein [Sporormia fimetaria CBS 119925]
MPTPESYELRRGKYARLDDPASDSDDSNSPRFSLSSTSSLYEDVESFDPLNYDAGTLKQKRSTSRLRSRHPSSQFPGPGNKKSKKADQKSVHWKPNLCSNFCCGLLVLFTASVVLILTAGGIWTWRSASPDGQSEAWYPSPAGGTDAAWAQSYEKAAKLVRQMTLVEKVNITTGTGWSMNMCVGNTGPVPRLGFPSLCLQDGPLGIRFADNATAFPAGVTVGATWNKELMYKRGRAHGKEARLKGVNVLLGPAMGPLGRLPAGGRNWEGFGSDPVLQGIGAAQTIRGIQDEGVMATAKHYVGNEQEHFRQAWQWGLPNAISSNIGDRALHEVYAWPFAESVRVGVASVMCAYNQVNSSYACQNSKLLNGILKDELGFQGWVQSDWLAQQSGVASALAGLDVTMPGDGLKWADGKSLWGQQLTKAVLNGSVPVERLDDMVTRVVAAWYQLGQDDRKKWADGPNFSSWTNEELGLLHPGSTDKSMGVVNKFVNVQGEGDEFHGKLVRQIAADGTVLVKNEDKILPLSKRGWRDGKQKDGKKFRVAIVGEDARLSKNGINACPDRGCNEGTLGSGWGSGAVEYPYFIEPLAALRDAFDNASVALTEWPENSLPDDEKVMQEQDLCIVFANADAGEGYITWNNVRGDRNSLHLQNSGDDLITRVSSTCGSGNSPVIVVIHSVGPVLLDPWIELPNIKAVLLAHLPSQESGNSLVDILFGAVNPSGRLPYTIGKTEADYGPWSKIKYLPSVKDGLTPQQDFSEGVMLDYRWFDKQKIAPRYPFGFGLSYTTFNLSDLNITDLTSGKRSKWPKARPTGIAPPHYPTTLPDKESALTPSGFKKLAKYIYPYLDSIDDITQPSTPPKAEQQPHPPSPAGGAQGGNPDLYTPLLSVTVAVTNSGDVAGAVVVQLYIRFPSNTKDSIGREVEMPVRVLRGFEKVTLEKGERKKVEFEVSRKDLSFWDTGAQNWALVAMEEGEVRIEVGLSSRDLRVSGMW